MSKKLYRFLDIENSHYKFCNKSYMIFITFKNDTKRGLLTKSARGILLIILKFALRLIKTTKTQ